MRLPRTSRRSFSSLVLFLLSVVGLVSSWTLTPSFSRLSIGPRNLSELRMSDKAACNEQTCAKFRGHTVLLTGASGGLGRALALQLSHCGAHTLVFSGRNEESLAAVAAECASIRSDVVTHIVTCDLNDAASVSRLAKEALEKCNGRIDVLINNGGVSSRSRFLDTKPEVDRQLMEINFLSGAALAKAVVPGMVERGHGYVVWISSVQGLRKFFLSSNG